MHEAWAFEQPGMPSAESLMRLGMPFHAMVKEHIHHLGRFRSLAKLSQALDDRFRMHDWCQTRGADAYNADRSCTPVVDLSRLCVCVVVFACACVAWLVPYLGVPVVLYLGHSMTIISQD
jgi:hypothetical protein